MAKKAEAHGSDRSNMVILYVEGHVTFLTVREALDLAAQLTDRANGRLEMDKLDE